MQGDEAGFLRLYERHHDAMFRFAYRMLGSREAAEDATHDCFLSLIKEPERFDRSKASLSTYLYAATRYQALKRLRQRGTQTTMEDVTEEPLIPERDAPLGKLLTEELAAKVRQAVESLPMLQREALILFEYEELSLVEVATVVGVDVGTVKARLHRARERLRSQLAPYLKSRSETIVGVEK